MSSPWATIPSHGSGIGTHWYVPLPKKDLTPFPPPLKVPCPVLHNWPVILRLHTRGPSHALVPMSSCCSFHHYPYPARLTEDIQGHRSGEMGCVAREPHTTAVGGSIQNCNTGQGDGSGTKELLPSLVPCVAQGVLVGAPYQAGQVHLLPLLHSSIGPYSHTHSWGKEEVTDEGLRAVQPFHATQVPN